MGNHSRQDLFRYLSSDLTESEKTRVENHLKMCRECSEFLAFVRNFNAALKQMSANELHPDTPCPDPETLAAFQAEELDERAAQLVRQHTVFCKDCLEELYLLRQADESLPIMPDKPKAGMSQVKWRRLVESMEGSVVDLGRKYGTDTLLGPSRIMSENPRYHSSSPQTASKSVQVGVGKNLYAITVESLEGNAIICELSALHESVKRPLNVSVRSGDGKKLVKARTDKHGFRQFVIVRPPFPNELVLLTLKLANVQQQILFRVPIEKSIAGPQLSHIEKTIVELVAQGYDTEAIGEELSLSGQSVRNHLTSVSDKLGISNVMAPAEAANVPSLDRRRH
jgi:DNA-binding CsgD family transcriptional regulator